MAARKHTEWQLSKTLLSLFLFGISWFFLFPLHRALLSLYFNCILHLEPTGDNNR